MSGIVLINRLSKGLFAEFVAPVIGNQRNVHVFWSKQPQMLLQIDLFRRGIEQVGTANDMRDMLLIIIDDDGELVGKNLIFSFDDKIAVTSGQVFR